MTSDSPSAGKLLLGKSNLIVVRGPSRIVHVPIVKSMLTVG